MRIFLAFWSLLLLAGFSGTSVAEEDDPFGTDSIFFFNVMSAAESEFYCKNKKLSAELRSASAEMMQAEIRARGEEGSTLKYSSDIFVAKKRNQLDLLEPNPFRDPSERKPPSCDEVKKKSMERLLKTREKILELLVIARDNAIKSQNDCPYSADYYRERHLRSSRIADLACFKKAAARELK